MQPLVQLPLVRAVGTNINSGYTVWDGPLGVGECGIIDLDFIVPMQPETI
ncbi:MAG TPA: hypothetical protein V6D37_15085 [Candidatus Sericytochromatia bacterium]